MQERDQIAQAELNATAVAAIEWLRATLDSGADAVAEQAPELFREVTLHGRIYETGLLALFLVLPPIGWFLVQFGIRHHRKAHLLAKQEDRSCVHEADDCIAVLSIAGGVVLMGFGLIWSSIQSSDALMAWTAPRLYFIERLMEVAL